MRWIVLLGLAVVALFIVIAAAHESDRPKSTPAPSTTPQAMGPVTAAKIRTTIRMTSGGTCEEVVSYLQLWKTSHIDGYFVRCAGGPRFVYIEDHASATVSAINCADAQSYDITCPE